MSVLIAYDGSAPARAAVRAAAELLPGGEAVVLTVYTTSARLDAFASAKASDPSAIDAMNGALAQLERETQHEAMAVAREGAGLAAEGGFAAEAQTVASRGSAWPLILEASTQRGSALLVCGTRGRGALSRAVLGSTSTALLHHTTLPILVVPERSSEVSGPVLIAYDGSAPARSAVETAAELFDGRSAVVVHVWESPMRHSRSGRLLGSAPITEARELTEELDEILASSAQQQAEEGAELARRRGLEARAEAVESASGVWRALIEAAVSTGTGVVAAGSRGRGAIASAVLGSVASGLVHNAELPVLIVPPSSESPSEPPRPTACVLRRRRVVSVDLGDLQVGVSEELLDDPERLAGSCELCGERVTEIVKSDDPHAGIAAGVLEAAADLGPVKRPARVRVAKDKIILRVVDGPL